MTEEKPSSTEQKPSVRKPKTKEELARDKRVRRNCCCCGGIVLLLMIIGIIITVRLFGASKDVPIIPSTTSPKTATTTTPTKTTANYPTPNDCQQVSTPSATALSISSDDPGLKQNADTIYYNVFGYTYTQLGNQVRQCGPKVGSESFGGMTNYNIGWKGSWDFSGGSCALSNETVGIKVDVYLPKWKQMDGYGASSSDWEHYISVLTDHENQHKNMDLAAAQSLYNQLISLPAMASCDDVNAQANAIYDTVMSDVAAQNVNFDTETNHGANQM